MRTYLVLILAVFFGCTSNKNSGKKEQTSSSEQQVKRDTLVINSKVYYLDSIPEATFESLKKDIEKKHVTESIDDTVNVIRDSLRLIFHLRNGVDSVLVNDTTESWSNYVDYGYMKACPEIDYWLVDITLYEGSMYLLLDRENGEKIWIWGRPVLSPNNKYFVCYSFDLEAGYDSNGFQLFEVINNKAILRFSKEIADWGPTEIRWKNDTIICIEQTRIDFNDSKDPYKESYVEMTIN
jgi:hypothetical protein